MSISKFFNLTRLALISPELLIALMVYSTWRYYPDWYEEISRGLKNNELPSYIGGLPFVLVVASYKLGMSILRPGDEDENEVLYRWSHYWALEWRVYGSMLICVFCCAAAILFYLNPNGFSDSVLGVILVSSVVISFVTVVTLLLAKQTLRKIMTLFR
jgi:hypothetical protein